MTVEHVPLGTGPPTRDEVRVYYAPKFSWWQLKLFINAGDLGLLKRDKKLQERYSSWSKGIQATYGSMGEDDRLLQSITDESHAVNYLMTHRLQWGKPDRLSLMPSGLDYDDEGVSRSRGEGEHYFTADIHPSLVSIIQNDWPYSVPLDVEHSLIWTKIPILPSPSLIVPHIAATLSPELQDKISARLAQDGLWGFTGAREPPPDPALLPDHLGALSEWGVTLDKLVISPKGSPREEEAVRQCGTDVQTFIVQKWAEREWETCWFVNPPRLQSVKGLAHIHVFARRKSPDETAAWDALNKTTLFN